ncbi:MAG: hypothetical protein ACREAA_03540 [Candidatus Polarisedimenticolia bacterium]
MKDHRLALSIGSRIGPYEIVAPLGAGGMGEAYRARDPRLGRDVAIKVLPETVTLDPERLARFEREARVLAALGHAGIKMATIIPSSTWPAEVRGCRPPPTWCRG